MQVPFWLSVVAVAALSCSCYLNSLDGDFLFDDSEAIVSNKDLRQSTPFQNLFSNDFWGDPINSSISHKSYRPFTVVTFRWSYYLGGGLNPFAFHLVNVVLHAFTSVLFLAVCVHILHESWSDAKWSAVTALLYAAHPVHSESVAAVVGRADLLASALFFLSILTFRRSGQQSQASLLKDIRSEACTYPACSAVNIAWLVVTVLLCAAAMLCKEQGLTAIGLCSAYDLLFICKLSPSDVFSKPSRRKLLENLRSDFQPFLVRQVTLAASVFSLLYLRMKVMGGNLPTFQPMDNPASFSNSTITRLLSYNYIYSLNAWLLLCPVWLCFDWAMGCIPLVETITDGRSAFIILFWSAFLLLAMRCLWPAQTVDQHREQRQVAMALAFLILPFLPASNLFFRVGFVIAERTLYLPSSGWCLLLALGVSKMFVSFPKAHNLLLLGLLALSGVFVGKSVLRSHVWRREETLYTSGLDVCPLNAKVHYNIGKIRADAGKTAEARAAYTEALRLYPLYDQALNNLGNLLKGENELSEAERLLEKAVAVNPKFAAAWMNLGIIKGDLNKTSEAERCYRTAITHRNHYPDAYYNLGNLYLAAKRVPEALAAWKNATLLKPDHKGAWHNMALLLEDTNRLLEAEAALKLGLTFLPESHDLYYCLGSILGKLDKYEESEHAFKKAVQFASSSHEEAAAYGNLGVLYHRAKSYEAAEQAYHKALHIHPENSAVKNNLEMLIKAKA